MSEISNIIKIKEKKYADSEYSRAFTLIELLVVISIIGMLSSIVLATVSSVRNKGSVAAGQTFDTHTYLAWNDNLTFSWDFDSDTASPVQDQTGNGNNLTVTDIASLVSDSNHNPFKNGKVLYIDSTSGKTANTTAALNLPPSGSENYSISFWLYPTSALDTTFLHNSFGLTSGKWRFVLQSSGQLAFILRTGVSSYYQVPALKLNQWYQVLGVCSNSSGTAKLMIYINGKPVDASAQIAPGVANCPINSSTNIVMDGANPYYIDNVRMYKNSFNIAMAEQLYLSEKAKYDNLAMK